MIEVEDAATVYGENSEYVLEHFGLDREISLSWRLDILILYSAF